MARRAAAQIATHPLRSASLLLAIGLAGGVGAHTLATGEARAQRASTAQVQRDAQRELNALSARLAEMQAEATRLNALGKQLVERAGLDDGEFDFDTPVGTGGGGRSFDITPKAFNDSLENTRAGLHSTGAQLEVLEGLLNANASAKRFLPSGSPLASSYVTSGFGLRADPFGAGGQFHKGIDFKAAMNDPVLAVADGVVSFAGVRTGYGNVIEVDHGNGLVTRYAHNSALSRRVGELVHKGEEVAKAGSTGRSTGVHVHLEVWKNGAYVDPAPFLKAQRG